MKALKLLLTFILFAFAFEGFAQDKIYLKAAKMLLPLILLKLGMNLFVINPITTRNRLF